MCANIADLLTPRGLAYWYMDDGSLNKGTPDFSSHGFTFNDVEILTHALSLNFGLASAVYRDHNRPRIYIKAQSRGLFKAIVTPYIVPCLRYKL